MEFSWGVLSGTRIVGEVGLGRRGIELSRRVNQDLS
jgi:hypothetical protein